MDKTRKDILNSIKEKASRSNSTKNPHPRGTPEAKAWDSGVKKRNSING